MLAWWQFFLCGGHQIDFDICTMLNLMSNSLSSRKLMKLQNIWLKYVLFGGHQMGFVPQLVEFGVKFMFLLQLHEKMVEIHPILWPLNGFCSLSC